MSVGKEKFFKVLPLLLSVFLFCGCRTDRSYQAEAAEKARKFLLENAAELTPAQIAFVKYNDPVLLTGRIFSGKATGLEQICITWEIPGAEYLYMVSGVSRARMDDWSPNRVLRRNYVKPSQEISEAVKFCRKYAVTNFYETLGKEDLNVIRFSNPEILTTSFPERPQTLENNPNSHLMNKVDEHAKAPETAEKEKVQISLQWKISDHRYAVFCGYADDVTLANWELNFAGFIPDFEANKVRQKVLKMPGDFNTPIEAAVKAEKK